MNTVTTTTTSAKLPFWRTLLQKFSDAEEAFLGGEDTWHERRIRALEEEVRALGQANRDCARKSS